MEKKLLKRITLLFFSFIIIFISISCEMEETEEAINPFSGNHQTGDTIELEIKDYSIEMVFVAASDCPRYDKTYSGDSYIDSSVGIGELGEDYWISKDSVSSDIYYAIYNWNAKSDNNFYHLTGDQKDLEIENYTELESIQVSWPEAIVWSALFSSWARKQYDIASYNLYDDYSSSTHDVNEFNSSKTTGNYKMYGRLTNSQTYGFRLPVNDEWENANKINLLNNVGNEYLSETKAIWYNTHSFYVPGGSVHDPDANPDAVYYNSVSRNTNTPDALIYQSRIYGSGSSSFRIVYSDDSSNIY